jgi:hypothetical protein
MKHLLAVILGLTFISTGCKQKMTESEKEKAEWNRKVDSTITYWEGRKMALPADLPVMTTDTSNFVNGRSTAHQKIVTYVDGTCGVCVTNLKHWKAFIDDIRASHGKCDFVFYIQSENKEDFGKDVMGPLGMNVTWIHDSRNKFLHDNDLYDQRFQTALLDDSDRVVLLGTMEFRPELKELFKKTILANSK